MGVSRLGNGTRLPSPKKVNISMAKADAGVKMAAIATAATPRRANWLAAVNRWRLTLVSDSAESAAAGGGLLTLVRAVVESPVFLMK